MKSIIKAMQEAVDIVLSSPHPDSKVAATLFQGDESLSKTNDWPAAITEKLGHNTRIGDSSGTLHAEVNCILSAGFTVEGASLAITDPCCPNCAKCIAEAGIKKIYIDHKGFLKDFAARRGDEFQDMSLRILAHAGIAIYEVNRKEQTIRTLYEAPAHFIPPEDNPIEIRACRSDEASLSTLMQTARLVKIKHPRWACALARDKAGKLHSLVASAHPAIGYTHDKIEAGDGKYDFMLEPLNRILMGCARHDLAIVDDLVWCSSLPTPREMVNYIGNGGRRVYNDSTHHTKKDASLAAKELLEDNAILFFPVAGL